MQKTNGVINGEWRMISVKTLLYDIFELLPNVEMQEEDRIIELIIQAASKLYNHKYYEKAYCLRLVSEHRAEMPNDYIAIRSVLGKTYNYQNSSSISQIDNDTENINNQLVAGLTPVTNDETYSIDYKYKAEYKNYDIKQLSNTIKWQYLLQGSSIMMHLKEQIEQKNELGCIDASITYCADCTHLYSVDSYGRLVTTIHTGLVFVEYLRLPKDEEGDLLIPYHADLQDAINAYVLYKLNVKDFNMGREGALQRMQYWQQQWQYYYLNVSNSLLMPSLSEQIYAIKNRSMSNTSTNIMNTFAGTVMNPTIRF